MKKHLIIADHSELVRRGLLSILKEFKKKFNFLEVNDSKQLISTVKKIKDGVLIVDYTTEGFSINDLISVKNTNPKIKMLAITPYLNAKTIIQAIKSGVDSHIKKECSAKEILESVELTSKGRKFYCSGIIDQMREESIDIENIENDEFIIDNVDLSERELQIIGQIAEGYTNAQIAGVLYISQHTVNTHRKNIMKKLGVNNTAGIVMYAVKTNLVKPYQFNFNYSK